MRLADCWMPVIEQAYACFGGQSNGPARAQLIEALDASLAHARDQGFAEAEIREALFAVVAWIDEQAMTKIWEGASAWRLTPLQRHYFSTTRAGVEFFDRLEALPEAAIWAREVFALMLLAGFQGSYVGQPGGKLTDYRLQLLERVVREQSMAPLDLHRPLFPCSVPIEQEKTPHRIIPRRPTLAAILLVVIPLVCVALFYGVYDLTLGNKIVPFISGH